MSRELWKHHRRAIVAIILLMLGFALPSAVHRGQPGELQAVASRVTEAGSYRFEATVRQSLIPRAAPATVGQSGERVDWHLAGKVQVPDHAYTSLQVESGSQAIPALTLIQDGERTFLLKDGQLHLVADPAGMVAPNSDYMAYLYAAENVQSLGTKAVAGEELDGYGFDVDGRRFALHVQQDLERQLKQVMPTDAKLVVPSLLERVTGEGELWVDERGLPRRQVLDLRIARATSAYDAELHMEVSFSQFGQIFSLPSVIPQEGGGWQLDNPASAVGGTSRGRESVSPGSLPVVRLSSEDWAFFLVCWLIVAAAVCYQRQRRRTYAVIAVTVAAVSALSPLLQALPVVRFYDRRAQAQAQTVAEVLALEAEPGEEPESAPSTTLQLQPELAHQPELTQVQVRQLLEDSSYTIERCGDGSPDEDTDGDELSDYVEGCLGTSPFEVDTDQDLVSDTLEIGGFFYTAPGGLGSMWTSNPFRADSNADGISDGLEWQVPEDTMTVKGCDTDGDGTPNLWDDDNDGDGVSDEIDLSPFTQTEVVEQFQFTSQGSDFDGYQYIEIQLIPENLAHLAYSTTPLDWPHDYRGQMQDLDRSPEDLRLLPYLEVVSNGVPDEELRQQYGVALMTAENGERHMLLPLFPQGTPYADDGSMGSLQCFYTKIAYGPTQLASIQWSDIRLVWLAQFASDRYVTCDTREETPCDYPGSRSCAALCVDTHTIVVQEYEEQFRVTGLQVTLSQDYELGVFGTPDEQEEDQQLFNLLFGMSMTFLEIEQLEHQRTDETALQHILRRFEEPDWPADHTWGVTATVQGEVNLYPHQDAALNDSRAGIVDFLDTWYKGDTQFCTLVLGVEERIGTMGLDEVEASTAIYVPLSDIDLLTNRALRLQMYEKVDGAWNALTPARMMDIIEERYADRWDSLLAEIQVEYPYLTEGDLRFGAYLGYLAWAVGRTAAIAVGDITLTPGDPPPEAALAESILKLGKVLFYNVPGYVLALTGLAPLVNEGRAKLISSTRVGTIIEIETDAVWPVYSEVFEQEKLPQSSRLKFKVLRVTLVTLAAVQMSVGIANIVCAAAETCNQDALGVANTVTGVMATLSKAYDIYDAVQKLGQGESPAQILSIFSKGVKETQVAAATVAIVGLVLDMAMIWTMFGLSWGGATNRFERTQLIVTAIVNSVLAILSFVLSFVPFANIVVLVIQLLDMLLGLFGFSIAYWAYRSDRVVQLESLSFQGLESSLQDEARGFIVGNRLTIEDVFTGTLSLTDEAGGDDSALDQADAFARFRFPDALPAVVGCAPYGGDTDATAGEQAYAFSNPLWIQCNFYAPVRDLDLLFETWIYYTLVYRECIMGFCSYEQDTRYVPEGSESREDYQTQLYLDVLPATVDNLWGWSALDNPDPDGDGLNAAVEAGLGTRTDRWDSDGDGLSDRFEAESREALGADPTKRDTDGDGLDDLLEVQLGTLVGQADSDDDGLLDGEEVPARNASDPTDSGWLVEVPAAPLGSPPLWVYSDPLRADADGDQISDKAERDAKTSPYARNDAPRLELWAEPAGASPDGHRAVYAKPGDSLSVSLQLVNTAAAAVSTTLEACFPGPSVLENLVGGTLNGSREPPTSQETCAANGIKFAWDFGSQQLSLQPGEVVSATFTANVVAASLSQTAEISCSLPYGSVKLARTADLVVDADNPQVMWIAPQDGAVLRGDYYVVGGLASDATTWPTGVELLIDSDPGPDESLGPPIVLDDPWAYSWELPPDGIYTLAVRATDSMGHQSGLERVTVTVDNSPPVVTILSPGGGWATNQTASVEVDGTAADDLSGLSRVEISTDGQPWQEVSFSESGSPPAGWSYTWALGEAAQGLHTVTARAADQAGNLSPATQIEFVVDAEPPTDDLTTDRYMNVPVVNSESLELAGHANDAGRAPLPPRPVALDGSLDAVSDATVWLEPQAVQDDDRGVSLTWLGDMNGDGRADLAIGMPASQDGAGKVVVVYGRSGDWSLPPLSEAIAESPTSFVGSARAGLGERVAAPGDVNGDGYADLLIGDRANDRAFLIFGRSSALGQDLRLAAPLPGRGVMYYGLPWSTDDTEIDVAAAGDVNGDGFDDLLLSQGSKAALVPGHGLAWPGLSTGSDEVAVLITVGPNGRCTGIGDVDGDGRDDLAVADPGNNLVYVLQGTESWHRGDRHPLDPAVESLAFLASSGFGETQVIPLGDVNGDGLADFAYSSGDAVQLVLGRSSGTLTTTVTFAGFAQTLSGFIAAPGDVNADGLDDILLGAQDHSAYLILGHESMDEPPVQATLTGVAGAASAPYAAGADLNCDGSSDLLLLPAQEGVAQLLSAEHGFGGVSFVSADMLPVARRTLAPNGMDGARSAGATKALEMSSSHYVDDDGDCAGNTPCYKTISAAVKYAAAEGQITVYPGVYQAFEIREGRDNLRITGVNPDAVFIEATWPNVTCTVRLRNVDGVVLSNLTLRDSENAICLERAGVGGAEDPTQRIVLDHLSVTDFAHGLHMDRSSTTLVQQCTFGNRASSDVSIWVDPTHPDGDAIPVWEGLEAVPGPMGEHGSIAAQGSSIYALAGGDSNQLYRYEPASDSWQTMASAPFTRPAADMVYAGDPEHGGDGKLYVPGSYGGSVNGIVHATVVSGTDVYVGGEFEQVTNPDGTPVNVGNLARWDGQEWHRPGRDASVEGPVYALTTVESGGQAILFVGGSFTTTTDTCVGDVAAKNLARLNLDGGCWEMNNITGVNGVVRALAAARFEERLQGDLDAGCPGLFADWSHECTVVLVGGDFTRAKWLDGAGAEKTVDAERVVQWWDNQSAVADTICETSSIGAEVPLCSLYTPWQREFRPLVDSDHPEYGPMDPVRAVAIGQASRTDIVPLECLGGSPGSPEYYDVDAEFATQDLHNYAGGDGLWIRPPYGIGITGDILGVYDGINWQGLMTGMISHTVRALALKSANLYVGGVFPPALGWVRVFDVTEHAADSWSQIGGFHGDHGLVNALSVADSGSLYVGGTFTEEVGTYPRFETTAVNGIARWDGQAWHPITSGVDGSVNALSTCGDDVWLGGSFSLSGSAVNFGRGSDSMEGLHTPGLYQYDPGSDAWALPLADLPFNFSNLVTLASDHGGSIYALMGGGGLWRYGVTAESWSRLTVLPFTAGVGASMAWVGSRLWILPGGDNQDAYKYLPLGNFWLQGAKLPFSLGPGADLAWDGQDFLYLQRGQASSDYVRYNIRPGGGWELLPPIGDEVNVGGSLAYLRPDTHNAYMYATAGGGTAFNRYGRLNVPTNKLQLQDTAFVAPAAGAATWINMSAPYADFAMPEALSSQWVGALAADNWSPAIGPADHISLNQADLLNPEHGVYRVGPNSQLASGYSVYHPDAYVSPDEYCPTCANDGLEWAETAFSSIQEAVDGGATNIFLRPGIYPEAFYLVSGSRVLGSGAERSIVRPPTDVSTGTLVHAEGVVDTVVTGLTLDGNGQRSDGLRYDAGASQALVARSIVRDTQNAIRLDGSATDVEVVNNTLVSNNSGLAATGCAGIDVRNTIFAHHSGTALSYERSGCSPLPTTQHRYNDYWSNEDDLRVDGTAEDDPGPGEIFYDPLFTDRVGDNYRPQPGSPVVDAGTPSDPKPPGTGGAVDIGYIEVGRAAFYADDDYCEGCLNDGLTWGLDAFARIQEAIDAAETYLHDAEGTKAQGLPITVGVGEGTYPECISVPSHVHLVGSGAGTTVIDGGGSASVVTVDGAVDVEVSHLWVTGSGSNPEDAGIRISASSTVTLTRNVVTGNNVGIRFDGGSTGEVTFNTILGNESHCLQGSGAHTSVDSQSNIVVQCLTGLSTSDEGLVVSDWDLVYEHSTADYQGAGTVIGAHNITDQEPGFVAWGSGDYRLRPDSPAVDAASPLADVPVGGGERADIGYYELLAAPITLMFGQQGTSCAEGNSGVKAVEVGIGRVMDWTQPLSDTLPSSWANATLDTPGDTGSYWTRSVAVPAEGLYRLFTRATDQLDNVEADAEDWYCGALVLDKTPPVVEWVILPTDTTDAALWITARASDSLDRGEGPRFDVAEVSFELGSRVYPAAWVDEGWDAESGGPRTFGAWLPLDSGGLQITAVAVDSTGNRGESATQSFTATTPTDVATVTSLRPGQAIPMGSFRVYGYARFASAGGTGHVTVQVDGNTPVDATLRWPESLQSKWWADVVVSGEGGHRIGATAYRSSGGGSLATLRQLDASRQPSSVGRASGDVSALSVDFLLDVTPPSLTIASPSQGAVVTRTVTLQGDASDAGSGLTAVDVSLDGGFVWSPADVSGDDWSFSWQVPTSSFSAGVLAHVRAVDAAGNVAVLTRAFIVDVAPPQGLVPVQFSIPEGTHLDLYPMLSITWTPAVDASGPVTLTLDVNQVPDSNPSTVRMGTSLDVGLDTGGSWYVHIAATDAAGNQIVRHYGPWYVGTEAQGTLACAAREQSILVDGRLDVASGEWRVESDLLDDDERGPAVQSLYATWDGSAFYLGWRGAGWELDGTMWAYLQAGGTGTSQPVCPLAAGSLPLQANWAVQIESATVGTLWHYVGGSWASGSLDFGHGPGDGTEIRLPLDIPSLTEVKLIAFALDDDGAVWTIFPTTNPLDPPWVDTYSWTDMCQFDDPNVGQPGADHIDLVIDSSQNPVTPWGPGATLEYGILVRNGETEPLANVQLRLHASAGLSYYGPVPGANRTAGADGDSAWTLQLPLLAPRATQRVTVTGRLGTLGALHSVTTTVTADASCLGPWSYSHRADGQPPEVHLHTAAGMAVRPGPRTLTGWADDAQGAGVSSVQAGLSPGDLRPASGTATWKVELDLPQSPLVTVYMQATDAAGNRSPVVEETLAIDSVPPAVMFALPYTLHGYFYDLRGTAADPGPPVSQVSKVEVQIADASSLWLETSGPYSPDATGTQGWAFAWRLPSSDGAVHQLRARAFDMAGNVTVTDWQSTVVDNVAPEVAVTSHINQVLVTDYLEGVPDPDPILRGTASDGTFVAGLRVRVHTAAGEVYHEVVQLDGLEWQYAPVFDTWAVGTYVLWVEAEDQTGNLSRVGPFDLAVDPGHAGELNLERIGTAACADSEVVVGITYTNTLPIPMVDVGAIITLPEGIEPMLEGSSPDVVWDSVEGTAQWALGTVGSGGVEERTLVLYLPADLSNDTVLTMHAALYAWGSEPMPVEPVTFAMTHPEIEVLSVAPEVIEEGDSVLLSLSFSDPQSADTHTAVIQWGDGSETALALLAGERSLSASHQYLDNPAAAETYPITVTVMDGDGCLDTATIQVTVHNVAPDIAVGADGQSVQYSDRIADVLFTATDVATDLLVASASYKINDGEPTSGLPAGLELVTSDDCTLSNNHQTCIWTLQGTMGGPQGTYTVMATVSDGDGGEASSQTIINVSQEDATVAFDGDNDVAVLVDSPEGDSPEFSLTIYIEEMEPDAANFGAEAGDINLAEVSMTLQPVAPGSPAQGTCSVDTSAVAGHSYDDVLVVTCSFDDVEVNTYAVEVAVDGDYYLGGAEDVLVVYDPSLGFTTGGGWFFWPGTTDKTNFGYNMKYNKKGTKVQGSLLLIRHRPDGSIYRVKSNALYGLAIGTDGNPTYGWASFSGKCTYLEPGWPEPLGNYEFVIYAEDHGEPGGGHDQIWIEIVAGLSMGIPVEDSTATLEGGNIVIPH